MIEGASVDNDEKEYQLIEGPLHKGKILIHTYFNSSGKSPGH